MSALTGSQAIALVTLHTGARSGVDGRWVAAESLQRKGLARRTFKGGYELTPEGAKLAGEYAFAVGGVWQASRGRILVGVYRKEELARRHYEDGPVHDRFIGSAADAAAWTRGEAP